MASSSVIVKTELLDEIIENVDADGVYLKAGVMEKGIDLQNGSEIDPRTYAAKHEFGIGVPERSFLRSTLGERRYEWEQQFEAMLIANDYDVVKTLEDMRTTVEGRIKEKFKDNDWKDLSPATIAYKKQMNYPKENWEKPLLATSTLMASISTEVVGK